MKKASVLLFLMFVVLFITGCGFRFPARYSETEQLSVVLPARGTLHVSTQNGGITIRSGDVNEVQITAEKIVHSSTDEEARQFCQETMIETETQPSGVFVFLQLPPNYRRRANISVGFEAVVPKSCSLDLDTSNGGIKAEGIEGNAEMRSSNGGIEAADIGGNVLADTSNGGIRLDRVLGSADAYTSNGKVTITETGGDIRCRTSNGGIVLDNVLANAEAATTNGGIECSLSDNASATVSASTSNGGISSDFPLLIKHNRLSGTIGEGKFSIELRTTNGGISLRRIK